MDEAQIILRIAHGRQQPPDVVQTEFDSSILGPEQPIDSVSVGCVHLDLQSSGYRVEITEQRTQRIAQLLPMDDEIDQSVSLKKFGGLESRRQILVGGLSDDAGSGESYHAFRLRQDEVAE